MVDVISKGAVIRRIEHADTMKLAVDYLSTEAVLVKSLGSNAWVLLNGWKVKPVVAGAGYVAPGATQSNITTARDGMGAGFTFNLPKLSWAINSQTANPTTAAQRAEKIIQKSSASGQPVGRCRQRHHVGTAGTGRQDRGCIARDDCETLNHPAPEAGFFQSPGDSHRISSA